MARVLVTMGYAYRVSERNYKRFLKDVAAGKDWNLEDYGKEVGSRTEQVTDITAEEAQAKLDDL